MLYADLLPLWAAADAAADAIDKTVVDGLACLATPGDDTPLDESIIAAALPALPAAAGLITAGDYAAAAALTAAALPLIKAADAIAAAADMGRDAGDTDQSLMLLLRESRAALTPYNLACHNRP